MIQSVVYYRVVIAERERAEITIHNPKGEKEQPKRFTFDSAYGVDATQREIYDRTASPIVGMYKLKIKKSQNEVSIFCS